MISGTLPFSILLFRRHSDTLSKQVYKYDLEKFTISGCLKTKLDSTIVIKSSIIR
jgi:hypothetical protein